MKSLKNFVNQEKETQFRRICEMIKNNASFSLSLYTKDRLEELYRLSKESKEKTKAGYLMGEIQHSPSIVGMHDGEIDDKIYEYLKLYGVLNRKYIAADVFDYAEENSMMDQFWDALSDKKVYCIENEKAEEKKIQKEIEEIEKRDIESRRAFASETDFDPTFLIQVTEEWTKSLGEGVILVRMGEETPYVVEEMVSYFSSKILELDTLSHGKIIIDMG